MEEGASYGAMLAAAACVGGAAYVSYKCGTLVSDRTAGGPGDKAVSDDGASATQGAKSSGEEGPSKTELAEALKAAVQQGVAAGQAGGGGMPPPGMEGPPENVLERFCIDLTQEARMGRLDPLVGREEEISRTVHVLSRRTKNNPCLLGESGVGKTAIVDGLAQRIASGDVPPALKRARVMALDHAALTAAGAVAPGEYEALMTALMQEIAAIPASKPPVVLFIDDIHNIMPAQPGAPDGGSVLKGPLGRGLLRCIGASSPDRFKKTIEQDQGLERRFQVIKVEEPSQEDAISILRGLRPRYERHHGVVVTEAAVSAAVQLSSRYIDTRQLPDKAIDLLDEAAAGVRIAREVKPEALDALERRVERLERERKQLLAKKDDKMAQNAAKDMTEKLEAARSALEPLAASMVERKKKQGEVTKIKDELHAVRRQMMKLTMKVHSKASGFNYFGGDDSDEEDAFLNGTDIVGGGENGVNGGEKRVNGDESDAKMEEKEALDMEAIEAEKEKLLRQQVDLQKRLVEAEADAHAGTGEVGESDIATVVSRWTGVPVTKLVASEAQKLLQLQDALHQRIIGQEEAVRAVSEAVQRSRANLSDPNGPIASFMFLGPTGVGKTELAKALAAHLFHNEAAMIRLDMSEYMEKHSVARLIGAPPGYVGFEEGGLLTDAVRRRPYSVVLFDEIEKAHIDVFNILLQLLDEGRVTDTRGMTVSFRNTLVIMTSNLGSGEIQADARNRIRMREKVMQHVRTHFRPEFINRLDDFIVFDPLNQEQIRQIVRLHATRVGERIADRRMKLELSENAVDTLAKAGFDPMYGARPVKRAFQRELLQMLAVAILKGEFGEEDTIVVDSIGKQLILTRGASDAKAALQKDTAEYLGMDMLVK